MKITAKDGKDGFKTVEECIAYEAELEVKEREAKAKEIKLKEEKQARLDALKKTYNDLIKGVDGFEKDYGVRLNVPEYNGMGIRFKSPFDPLNIYIDRM